MAQLIGKVARRTLLRRHMAQEIVAEEALLRLTRLCGINCGRRSVLWPFGVSDVSVAGVN
jgi:hypothetical protein